MGFLGFVGFVRLGSEGSAHQTRSIIQGPMLDAHNCYPEDGKWNDRLARALGTTHTQIGIEQDLIWKPDGRGGGVSVVAHETLLPAGATNYRRWANFGWSVVERGHRLGLWMRFYTLDGYGPGENKGWSESYNFGSLAAVQERWRAAVAAGVDFVATNQYEEFAAFR